MKKSIKFGVTLLTSLFLLISCQSNAAIESVESESVENTHQNEVNEIKKIPLDQLQTAYFASGCFWCVEAVFESVKGVYEVHNGYAGGHTSNPTYEDSNTGTTGHAEAVEIFYDSTVITFKELVDVYFGSQNIEQVNGQGPDNGSQYRTIAFYKSSQEKEIIDSKIKSLTNEGYKVGSEVKPFEKFWMGEDYHQDYERLHPNQGYIQSVSIPRLNKFKAKYPDLLKENSH